MKIPLWITIAGSAVFIAVMFLWKEALKAGVDEYGAWVGFAVGLLGIAFAYWIDSRRKPPTGQ